MKLFVARTAADPRNKHRIQGQQLSHTMSLPSLQVRDCSSHCPCSSSTSQPSGVIAAVIVRLRVPLPSLQVRDCGGHCPCWSSTSQPSGEILWQSTVHLRVPLPSLQAIDCGSYCPCWSSTSQPSGEIAAVTVRVGVPPPSFQVRLRQSLSVFEFHFPAFR